MLKKYMLVFCDDDQPPTFVVFNRSPTVVYASGVILKLPAAPSILGMFVPRVCPNVAIVS